MFVTKLWSINKRNKLISTKKDYNSSFFPKCVQLFYVFTIKNCRKALTSFKTDLNECLCL